jgi:hypothetical protein
MMMKKKVEEVDSCWNCSKDFQDSEGVVLSRLTTARAMGGREGTL